jgi:hypothetical protein
MRRLPALVVVASLLTMGGCGSKRASTPAEEIDATHGGKTVTTHGEILRGSPIDTGDGKVIYGTEDGTKHEVQRQPDGSYTTPNQVK